MFLRIHPRSPTHNMPMRIRDRKKEREQNRTNEQKPVNGESLFDTLDTSKFDTSKLASGLPETGKGAVKSDVLGSYTGTGVDYSAPVQDADDL